MKTMIQRVARGARSRVGPFTFLVLAAVTLCLPSLASATPVMVEFAEGLVLSVVAPSQADASGWTYNYTLTNNSSPISVTRMSIGFGSSAAGEDLANVEITTWGLGDLAAKTRSGFPRLSSSSLLWNFALPLTPGVYAFTVTYEAQIAAQNISMASSPAIMKTIDYTSVPEPATLFLVGAGMLALGTVMRRKTR